MKSTLSALLILSALHGCATIPLPSLQPAPAPARPAGPARPVVTPETRLVLMPYGQYAGQVIGGTATLDLSEDQRFTLSWEVPIEHKQGQWSGEFEWLLNKSGFETLALFGVREAVNGTLTGQEGDHWQVVSQLDREQHRFAISVPDLGTVRFAPK
ncbi:MAG: hypothetical protein JXX28_01805 [Deltaproteobacteria bacterium]|nr:hypothetical protein [Deltaproteobacteria bacterium]